MKKIEWAIVGLTLWALLAIPVVAVSAVASAGGTETTQTAAPSLEATQAAEPDTDTPSADSTDTLEQAPADSVTETDVAEQPDELALMADYSAAVELALFEANTRLEAAGLEPVIPPDPSDWWQDGGEGR